MYYVTKHNLGEIKRMREICENKDDLKFFMCELINNYIEEDPALKGDRKMFSKSTGGRVSEPLLSRIKKYDIDAVKLDSIMAVFFNLKIDLVFSFEPSSGIKKENQTDFFKKNKPSYNPSF